MPKLPPPSPNLDPTREGTGFPGGGTYPYTTLSAVPGVTAFGWNARQAVDLPRLHHQWLPDAASFDAGVADAGQSDGGSPASDLGNADGVIAARTVDTGWVRMTDRHLGSDPPTAEQITAAEADVDAAIDEAARTVALDRSAAVVGGAGTRVLIARGGGGPVPWPPAHVPDPAMAV